jgi:hypothetical protein
LPEDFLGIGGADAICDGIAFDDEGIFYFYGNLGI